VRIGTGIIFSYILDYKEAYGGEMTIAKASAHFGCSRSQFVSLFRGFVADRTIIDPVNLIAT
jgi:hypothetical protein